MRSPLRDRRDNVTARRPANITHRIRMYARARIASDRTAKTKTITQSPCVQYTRSRRPRHGDTAFDLAGPSPHACTRPQLSQQIENRDSILCAWRWLLFFVCVSAIPSRLPLGCAVLQRARAYIDPADGSRARATATAVSMREHVAIGAPWRVNPDQAAAAHTRLTRLLRSKYNRSENKQSAPHRLQSIVRCRSDRA